MFFGGLFAYDLVAGFEDLPPLEATPPARITASIWRKRCWLSTIKPKHPYQASLFAAGKRKTASAQRLTQLRQQLNEPPAPLPVTTVAEMSCDCDQSDEETAPSCVKYSAPSARARFFQVVPSRRFSLPCPSPLALMMC